MGIKIRHRINRLNLIEIKIIRRIKYVGLIKNRVK